MEPEVANFADIIKIAIMLIKITLRDLIKVKRIRQNLLRCNITKLLISGEKMLMSAKLMGCVAWSIYFLDFL